MKRIVSALTFCLLVTTLGLAQDNDKIQVKGDYLEIDMKCTTAYRNFQATGKEYVEIDKVILKRSSILSIVVYDSEVIITTSELSWGNATNVSKHYTFKFSDPNLLENFYLSLADNISTD